MEEDRLRQMHSRQRRLAHMNSPFPGMDPFLETRWGDVHASLIIYARDALNRLLPTGLLARSEERTIVSEPDGLDRSIYPDVPILEKEGYLCSSH